LSFSTANAASFRRAKPFFNRVQNGIAGAMKARFLFNSSLYFLARKECRRFCILRAI
jgi:hypothetical protein